MSDYLISLLDNPNNFTCDVAKGSHTILLCWVEQGEVRDYTQAEIIIHLRRANVQRHDPPNGSSSQYPSKKKYASKPLRACLVNISTKALVCTNNHHHNTPCTFYNHICIHCFAATGKMFSHAESECHKNTKTNYTD